MQRLVPLGLAVALMLAPLSAKAADLVVWWNEGYYAEEDEAVREIIAAFEEKTGKQVELTLHPEQDLPDKVVAAVEAGEPPDFVFSIPNIRHAEQWAYEGRLVDLTDTIGHFADLFDRDALEAVSLLDATTGRHGLYLLPVGFATHHVHAWKSLLERAGFTLADIPKEWWRFGLSGATGSSPPCAKPWAATTSGVWVLLFRSIRTTRRTGSGSSWTPTRPTM